MELLFHSEFVGPDICQNPTAAVADSVTRIGDALAIGAGTHVYSLRRRCITVACGTPRECLFVK